MSNEESAAPAAQGSLGEVFKGTANEILSMPLSYDIFKESIRVVTMNPLLLPIAAEILERHASELTPFASFETQAEADEWLSEKFKVEGSVVRRFAFIDANDLYATAYKNQIESCTDRRAFDQMVIVGGKYALIGCNPGH